MNRVWFFVLALFLPCVIWAKIEWSSQYRFVLAKDEPAYIWVYSANDDAATGEEFRFSWTLFDTKQLVLHARFRGFPEQYILTLDRGRTTMRQEVMPDPIDRMNGNVHLILEFVEFDNKEKLATIDAFIQDRNGRAKIEFIDPRRRQGE